jgi:acetylornithine deacetylase
LDRVRERRPDSRIERPAPRLIDEALDTSPSTPLAMAASEACLAAGADPKPIGVPYGTDASKLQGLRGIPAIVLGPGSITRAHGAEEYVPLDELACAVDIYAGIALRMQRGEGVGA